MKYDLFVPGRLCIFGEHSDWVSQYSSENNNIPMGQAIVALLDKGIYASVKHNKRNIFSLKENDSKFSVMMNLENIKEEIDKNNYYSYVASTLYFLKKEYNVGGINIEIVKNDLPQKKGLSSSAAICVLICKAFNKIYNLNLSHLDEMNLAYKSERFIGSMCGKMDQIVATNQNVALMNFESGNVNYQDLLIGNDMYFVYADLMSKKDTKLILSMINNAFPFPSNKCEEDVLYYFEKINPQIISKAIKLIEDGNVKEFGKLLNYSQEMFDKYVSKICKEELTAPKLHSVINDKFVIQNSLGAKGVGSQGDGAVQIIVENKEKQIKLVNYLNKKLKMDAYPFTLHKNNEVKKAIIPLAGYGTRMKPFTNAVPKSFIPIVHNGMFKPVFLILIEELIDAGIDKIALIIDKKQEELYNNVLYNYDKKIIDKITYIFQEEKNGLGDAILCCTKFLKKDKFLLVLGDQIYSSNSEISCTKQLLNKYYEFSKLMISVSAVEEKLINNYGIFFGTEKINSDVYKIDRIIEKPSLNIANKIKKFDNKYYAAFGEYILDYKIIEEMLKYKRKFNNEVEIPFTELLNDAYNEIYGFIPNGYMNDVGNIISYEETMRKKYGK